MFIYYSTYNHDLLQKDYRNFCTNILSKLVEIKLVHPFPVDGIAPSTRNVEQSFKCDKPITLHKENNFR